MAYALITGASSGIGREMAVILAGKSYDLILVARRRERLEQLKTELEEDYGVTVLNFDFDLSLEGSAEELFERLRKEHIVPEILINNAGFGDYGHFSSGRLPEMRKMIAVNNTAVVALSYEFLQDALKQGRGRILNVASLISFFPFPYYALYAATKSFLLSFSESLRGELKDSGISVSVLCPGPTDTEFFTEDMRRSRSFRILPVLDVRTVARKGIEGMMKGRAVIIPGLLNKFISASSSFFPRAWVRKFNGAIGQP